MADTTDLKSVDRKIVLVRVQSPVPILLIGWLCSKDVTGFPYRSNPILIYNVYGGYKILSNILSNF